MTSQTCTISLTFTTEYLKKPWKQVSLHPLSLHSESFPAGVHIILHVWDNSTHGYLIS